MLHEREQAQQKVLSVSLLVWSNQPGKEPGTKASFDINGCCLKMQGKYAVLATEMRTQGSG